MPMLTVVSLEPLTDCVVDVLLYEPLVVPYSNHTVDDNPLAFTVPFKVAELEVMSVAKPVGAVGGNAAAKERLLSSFETKTSAV